MGEKGRFSLPWVNFFANVYRVCLSVTQSGTTAQRPTKNLFVGRQYFDTTLGHVIHYDGTNWVDATGSTV